MFGFEEARDSFVGRFEQHGNNWIYRPTLSAPPVSVSDSERDDVIRTFKRNYFLLIGLCVGGTSLAVALMVFFDPGSGPEIDQGTLWAVSAALIGGFGIAWYWIWREPTRRFARRAPTGKALDNKEARRVALGKLSYFQLGSTAVAIWLFALSHIMGEHRSPWTLPGWVAFAILTSIIAAVQAVRKWRTERNDE